jgi:kinetochore protein NDC80
MLNDIVKFKLHVQKTLEDYEGFVIEEAEQEAFAVDDMDETNKMEF